VTPQAGTIGDFLRAVTALRPRDAATLMAVRDMLGFARLPAVAEPIKDLGPWQGSIPASNRIQAHLEATGDPGARPQPERQAQPESSDRIPAILRLVREGTGRPEPPAWLTAPGEIVSSQPPLLPALPNEPLFGGTTRRALVTAILATDAPEGDLDLELIVERVSALHPIVELPRRAVPTLRQGVQLLLDFGQGMDPYADDRDSLAASLGDILPNDRIAVLHFAGCPTRGCGSGPREDWRPWHPPIRGTPVLALSDLGIGGPAFDSERARTSEWLAFASRAKAIGCPLAALVPYAADRWPPRLARAMRLLHWSERATTRQMTHTRRRRG
jgi:hypothetical protein